MPLESIKDYLLQIDQLIADSVSDTNPSIVSSISPYLLKQGKRIRPALVYISALACSSEITPQCHRYALTVELIHCASLFHDDILDNARIRRGRAAAPRVLGQDTAVLAGDLLYMKALTAMETESLECRQLLNRTVTAMIQSEIIQALNRFKMVTESQYYSIIEGKTAALISLACRLGAGASGEKHRISTMAHFGNKLGIAFQMIDDLLDWIDAEELAKDLFSDVREGRMTLPLIRLMATMNHAERKQCSDDLLTEKTPVSQAVADCYRRMIIDRSVAIQIRREALALLEEALCLLQQLPESSYRDDMITLSQQIVSRGRPIRNLE